MQTQTERPQAAPFAGTHRAAWRNALSSVFGAAWRLHHYRDVHTRMLRDALCGLDCHESQIRCRDE